MAGDWIKWTKGLAKKPEVMQIASRLGLTRHAVAGLLMEVWEWADDNAVLVLSGSQPDRCAGSVRFGGRTDDMFAALTGVSGVAEAMREVGWLSEESGVVTFPNFGRHNGKPAKSRALDTARKRTTRVAPVRKVSGSQPDKNRTREEKRREEKKEKKEPPNPPAGGGAKPPPFDPLAVELPHPSPAFAATWAEWVQHRREKRDPLTATSVKKQLRGLAGLSEADATACIEHSIARGWVGLFPENYGHGAGGRQRSPPAAGKPAETAIDRVRRIAAETHTADGGSHP